MPNPLQKHLLTFLDEKDLLSMRRVDTSWRYKAGNMHIAPIPVDKALKFYKKIAEEDKSSHKKASKKFDNIYIRDVLYNFISGCFKNHHENIIKKDDFRNANEMFFKKLLEREKSQPKQNEFWLAFDLLAKKSSIWIANTSLMMISLMSEVTNDTSSSKLQKVQNFINNILSKEVLLNLPKNAQIVTCAHFLGILMMQKLGSFQHHWHLWCLYINCNKARTYIAIPFINPLLKDNALILKGLCKEARDGLKETAQGIFKKFMSEEDKILMKPLLEAIENIDGK